MICCAYSNQGWQSWVRYIGPGEIHTNTAHTCGRDSAVQTHKDQEAHTVKRVYLVYSQANRLAQRSGMCWIALAIPAHRELNIDFTCCT